MLFCYSKQMKKMLAVALVFLFLATCVTATVLQTVKTLFQPYQQHVTLAATIDQNQSQLPLNEVKFVAADGVPLVGYAAEQPSPKGWIVLVHGFTPNGWKSMLGLSEFFYAEGYNIFIPSLRSFGDSGGQDISLGTAEWQDVAAAHAYVQELNSEKLPVGWYGVSMGAASSIVAAGETTPPDFLMVMVPFANLQSYFEKQLTDDAWHQSLARPFIAASILQEFGAGYQRYTASSQMAKLSMPLMIIAGINDNQVKYSDSQLLYLLASTPIERKTLLSIEGGHDLFAEQPGSITTKLREFLNTLPHTSP